MENIRTRIEIACECPKCKHHFVIKEEVKKGNIAQSTVHDRDWVDFNTKIKKKTEKICEGETRIIREGDLDGLSESGFININWVEELGPFQINKKEDTILYKVTFLKDWIP